MAEAHNSAHVISLFRFRMQDSPPSPAPRIQQHYRTVAHACFGAAGFISFRHSTSHDGEILAVVEFASAEALTAWRDHPDHRTAQQRGRNDLYAEYEIINCAVLHRYGYQP